MVASGKTSGTMVISKFLLAFLWLNSPIVDIYNKIAILDFLYVKFFFSPGGAIFFWYGGHSLDSCSLNGFFCDPRFLHLKGLLFQTNLLLDE
jgi:hypothetical protein